MEKYEQSNKKIAIEQYLSNGGDVNKVLDDLIQQYELSKLLIQELIAAIPDKERLEQIISKYK